MNIQSTLNIVTFDFGEISIQSTPDSGTPYFGQIRFWRHICVAPTSSMKL